MRYSLLLALGIFAAALALGMQVPSSTSAEVLEQLGEVLGPVEDVGPLGLLAIILANNLGKALLVILLSVLLGIPPLAFILINGAVLGVVVSGIAAEKGYLYTIAGLAPHGIIEVPLILLTSAIGLRVGAESLKWLTGRQSQVRSQWRRGLMAYLKLILPGLVVAALIETFITPLVIRLA